MISILSKKPILIGSLIVVLAMFTIVMFIVNPLIDGKNGFEVIALQLSFQKEVGILLVNGWGESGISNFNAWIFTDYLYAFSYSVFLGSLLSVLIVKKGKENSFSYTWTVPLVFVAGLCDCIENTIELYFINNLLEFSSFTFYMHSLIASIKWLILPVVIFYIINLLFLKNKS